MNCTRSTLRCTKSSTPRTPRSKSRLRLLWKLHGQEVDKRECYDQDVAQLVETGEQVRLLTWRKHLESLALVWRWKKPSIGYSKADMR